MARLIAVALLLPLLSLAGLSQGTAETELRAGIAAYDKFEYADAVHHLKEAVRLEPNLVPAHLYLAKAYYANYCENCEIETEQANVKNEEWRILGTAEFRTTLELQPSNIEALHNLGYISFWRYRLDESERFYRTILNIDAKDFEALYSLGVIDWQRSYTFRMTRQLEFKFKQNQALVTHKRCPEIRANNLERTNEAVSLFSRAVEVLEVSDAMRYLSLSYQERASIQCGNKAAYERDMIEFRLWEDRASKAQALRNLEMPPRIFPPPPPPPPPRRKSKH